MEWVGFIKLGFLASRKKIMIYMRRLCDPLLKSISGYTKATLPTLPLHCLLLTRISMIVSEFDVNYTDTFRERSTQLIPLRVQ